MDNGIHLNKQFTAHAYVPYLLALTLFLTPLSSSGKSIFVVLSMLAILLTPIYRKQLIQVIKKPWCIAGFSLFSMAIVACLWSPATLSREFFIIEKYSKLLYLPLLAIGFTHKKTRTMAIHAFILAMLFTCVLATLKFHGFLTHLSMNPDHIFRNHIMTGFMVAFASYLSLLIAFNNKKNPMTYAYLCLAILFTYYILFINEGRTGYVIYLLLVLLLVIQLCSWWQALAGILLISVFFIGSYLTIQQFHDRVDSISQGIRGYQYDVEADKASPIGLRLQFHDFAHSLFNKHPLIGNGTGSFSYYFDSLNPVPVWRHSLMEPHSQYWLIASEFGSLGLFILAFFFYSLFKACWSLKSMKHIGIGLLIPFFIGNYSDSLLFYSGSGYFFLLFMAICLGEQIETENNSQHI